MEILANTQDALGGSERKELEPTPVEMAPAPDQKAELPTLSKYELDLLRQIVARGERTPIAMMADKTSLPPSSEPLSIEKINADILPDAISSLEKAGYIITLDKVQGFYSATDKGRMVAAGNPEIKTEDSKE